MLIFIIIQNLSNKDKKECNMKKSLFLVMILVLMVNFAAFGGGKSQAPSSSGPAAMAVFEKVGFSAVK